MRIVEVTAPTIEPLTLTEAKKHLIVETTDDDVYINSLIKAARRQVETITRRALITQTWDLYLDDFPGWDGYIEVPKGTLQSVTSITYVDENGTSQTLSSSNYQVSTAGAPGRITPAYELDWPVTRDIMDAVIIRFVAGYGDSASDVPDDIRHAMKMIISNMYDNREPVIIGTTASIMPMGVDSLLATHRVRTFY